MHDRFYNWGTELMAAAGIKFRPEIDGLRSIAVLAVIFFHAVPSVFSGGFLGVDIFFAISGFLITGVITAELEDGHFSFLVFYERRLRRIFPALLVMMAIVNFTFYFFVLPHDLQNIGQATVASVLSANNILLYTTQNYFSTGSDFRPLMHTWSLGIEEQFYTVVPIIMFISYKIYSGRGEVFILGLVTITSFGVCVYLNKSNPEANFYLIFSRAWELGIGALTMFAERRLSIRQRPRKLRESLAMIGLIFIFAGVFLVTPAMGAPGIATLVPIIGACLVLAAASQDTAAGMLLGLRPFTFIGSISYSVYLYYQPIFVFARIVRLDEPSPTLMVSLVPVIFLFGWFSWRFVEQPFRKPLDTSRQLVFTTSMIGGIILIAVGLIFHFTSGFYRNWPELANEDPGFGPSQNAGLNMRPYKYKDANFPLKQDRKNILVVGNSFARDFINMGEETGVFKGLHVSYSDVDDCVNPLPTALQKRAINANFVILGSGVEARVQNCFLRRIRDLRGLTTARLIVLGTKSFGWNNNAVMLLPADQRYQYRTFPLAAERGYNRDAKRVLDPTEYVDILAALSDTSGRVPVFTPDHKFISQDKRHLTEAGARYVGNILFSQPVLRPLRELP